jgi:glycosyltransferase involved in cell wall biosynthesis
MATGKAPATVVSVVVPVFGTEAYLPACLASVLHQSFRDIEVIVVDDSSPGDVAGIAARVAGDDKRVKLIRHARNQGLLNARLTGCREASGTYIAHVDSDDVVEERFIELLHAAAVRNNADLVQCAITVVEPNKPTRLINRGGPTHALQRDSVLEELLAGGMSNMLGNKLIRTSCWRAATAGLNDEWRRISFGEDLLLLFRVASRSRTYAHIADALYRYTRRIDGITMKIGEASIIRRIDDLNRVYGAILPRLAASGEPEGLKAEFFQREFVDAFRDLLESAGWHNEAKAVGTATWPHVYPLFELV